MIKYIHSWAKTFFYQIYYNFPEIKPFENVYIHGLRNFFYQIYYNIPLNKPISLINKNVVV